MTLRSPEHAERAASGANERNLSTVSHVVRRSDREAKNGHRGGVLWMTGLPASGKSTLAMLLESRLFSAGYCAYVLDGDNIRRGLSGDLSFSLADRTENLRRIAEVAKLMAEAGLVCIAAFISPLKVHRDEARRIIGTDFNEVFIKASIAVCESRDPKGLYRKARAGMIAEFSGISSPYEPPRAPDLIVSTEREDVETSLACLLAYSMERFSLPPDA